MEIKLEEKSCSCFRDHLTGLYNRTALLEQIKTDKRFSIFLIDIDNFSNINNTHGYFIADEVLVSIANYLNKIKPPQAELFRFSGDQFIFLCDPIFSDEAMEEFAQLVISFFHDTEVYCDEAVCVKVFLSIGMYVGSGDKLLQYASFALDDVRKFRKNTYKMFDKNSAYIQQQLDNIHWISNVREYLEEEKFSLFYQPIQDNKKGKIEKYECLLRIKNEERIISPVNFLHACKETGILERLTRFVISSAFKQFANTDIVFSINITSEDINLDYLESLLLQKSKQYNIKPEQVILEVLEDITTFTDPHMNDQINSLREKGFLIALDDFGVENSNFARLIELRPDFIKIDGIFIKNIVEEKKSQIIVQTIVDFCKLCDIEVIAEFVHDEAVQNKVLEYAIEYSQGYFIGEPKQNL